MHFNIFALCLQIPPRSQVSVISDQVGSASRVGLNGGISVGRQAHDPAGHRINVGDVLQSHQVSRQPGDMRTRHARPAQGSRVRGATDPHTLDLHTGGEDVDELAEIAKGCLGVRGLVDGADSNGSCRRGGGVVGGVDVLVTCCDHGNHAGRAESVDGGVDGV